MRDYRHPALRQLSAQQVRFATNEQRLEQLNRAERFLAEVLPGKRYPYQFVCWRITQFRPDSYPQLLIEAADLEHDLGLLIEELAKSMPPAPAESASEPILTLGQVSRQLRVSTKTISRWRDRGLVCRRVLCNGRRMVGVRQSLLDRFLEQNRDQVDKSSRFSQLSEEDREEILRRAKRMARVAPDRFTDICRRIASKVGRSTEAVRYTIKNFDRTNSSQAIFPAVTGPLDDQAKQRIYASYRRGISVTALARLFRRTPNSVHRIINEERARRLLSKPLDHIPHASFDDPAAEAGIMQSMPDLAAYEASRTKARNSAPKGLPPELSALYEVPLLSREQEAHLFRQMNFLKHKALELRGRIDPSRARASDLDRLEILEGQAQAVKDQLISANMRLVASIAKRHAGLTDNYFELLSDGNMSLIRAVEKFDFSRGNKFSTYASWAIMKNFARSVPDEKTRRGRFLTGHEELFELAADRRSDEHEIVADVERKHQQVRRLLDRLDDREQLIMRMRFGIDAERNMTLEQVGKQLCITKERVRQLEARTMTKLRNLAKQEKVELP